MSETDSERRELLTETATPPAGERGKVPEYLRLTKTMHIAVSGGVLVTETELRILDTPDFQRLRGIRQLGLAHLVYPTALHTRFDHSLGTLQMAGRMVQAIRDNTQGGGPDERDISNEQAALIRIYALVHDVTHIPFGHSIEDELKLLVRHDENEGRIQRFLGANSEIGKIIAAKFGNGFLEKLLEIYRWDGTTEHRRFPADEVFIHDLVSGTVCADLLDYLQRDNHFCNLGVPLEYHFIKYLYLRRDEDQQRRVFVRLWKDSASGGRPRRDTLTDLCRLLDTRYLIAERVYFHHAKIAAGVMLGRAIQEALRIGEIDEKFLWDKTDEILLASLRESKSELVKRLATEVTQRRLYKEHRAFGWEEVEKRMEPGIAGLGRNEPLSPLRGERELPNSAVTAQPQYDDLIRGRIGEPGGRREFENQIAEIIGAQPGDVLLYVPTRKMNRKEADMNVLWEGRPTLFKNINDPVVGPRLNATLDAHKLLWSIRLLVRRSLTSRQRELASELCEVLLLSHAGERAEKLRAVLRNAKAKLETTE